MLKFVSIRLRSVFSIVCLVIVFSGAWSPCPLPAQEQVTPLLDGMVIGLQAADGKYVGASPGDASDVVADRDALGTYEKFTVFSLGYNKFAFKADVNSKYLQADPDSGSLLAAADAVSTAQTFYVIYHGDSLISLKADANDKYVQQNQSDGGKVRASADAIGPWEKFTVAFATLPASTRPHVTPFIDGQAIGFKSDQGLYWIADYNQRTEVLARSPQFDSWETFTVKNMGDNQIALRSSNGKYVRADPTYDGRFLADSDGAYSWETFEVIYHGNDEVSLIADVNGKMVGRNPGEDNRIQAVGRLDELTGAYRFTVVVSPQAASVEYTPLMAAVEKYAPQVIFQQGEAYLPCSVEDFLNATTSVNATDPENGYLEITDEAIKAGKPGSAKAYVNIVSGPIYTDIQYWFLYGYNGPATGYSKMLVPFKPKWPPWASTFGTYESLGDHSMSPAGQHEGDWEHISVRIRNDNYAGQNVYYSWHSSGTTATIPSANQDNRIIFYASKNGHAAYATAERHYPKFISVGVYEFRLLDDTSNPSSASSLDFRGKWVLIGASLNGDERTEFLEQAGATNYDWMKYTGRWGRVRTDKLNIPSGPMGIFDLVIDSIGIIDEFDEEKGPSPPWTKSSWTKPEF